MPACIRPTGQLKSYLNNQSEITVEAGRTVREILVMLQIKPEVVAGVIVNGDLQSKDYTIQEDDVIKLFSIMGGG